MRDQEFLKNIVSIFVSVGESSGRDKPVTFMSAKNIHESLVSFMKHSAIGFSNDDTHHDAPIYGTDDEKAVMDAARAVYEANITLLADIDDDVKRIETLTRAVDAADTAYDNIEPKSGAINKLVAELDELNDAKGKLADKDADIKRQIGDSTNDVTNTINEIKRV
jgi:hypothetical protein